MKKAYEVVTTIQELEQIIYPHEVISTDKPLQFIIEGEYATALFTFTSEYDYIEGVHTYECYAFGHNFYGDCLDKLTAQVSRCMGIEYKEDDGYIMIPIYSEYANEYGDYEIIGYKREYV